MAIRAKPCSILGTFCFRVGSVIVLARARDLLAIHKVRFFLKSFLIWEGCAPVDPHTRGKMTTHPLWIIVSCVMHAV